LLPKFYKEFPRIAKSKRDIERIVSEGNNNDKVLFHHNEKREAENLDDDINMEEEK